MTAYRSDVDADGNVVCTCVDIATQSAIRLRQKGETQPDKTEAKVTRIPAEDPDVVRARDRADLDRDFPMTRGADPVAYLEGSDE